MRIKKKFNLILATLSIFLLHSEESPVIKVEGGYRVGEFIGLKQNYDMIRMFIVTPKFIGKSKLFVDLNGYKLEENDLAVGVGAGIRLFTNKNKTRLFGCGLFYDYRTTCLNDVKQIGVVLESLGERVDYRLNIYIPVNEKVKLSRQNIFDNYTGGYHATCQHEELSFTGANFTFGFYILQKYFQSFYCAVGPYYYFNNKTNSIFGNQILLKLNCLKNLYFEINVSNDCIYKTHAQCGVTLSFPFGKLFNENKAITKSVLRNGVPFTKNCNRWTWNW